MKKLVLPLLAISCLQAQNGGRIHSVKVTVLSTMLADAGIGEWGFSALVTADGREILFDTGARPDTVLANSRELNIDLARVEQVILSHNHVDHTGGLLKLRRELSAVTPSALSVAHVSKGIFLSRLEGPSGEGNTMIATRKEYEAGGGNLSNTQRRSRYFPAHGSPDPCPASIRAQLDHGRKNA